jgi:hypothetical protein
MPEMRMVTSPAGVARPLHARENPPTSTVIWLLLDLATEHDGAELPPAVVIREIACGDSQAVL